MAMTFTIASAAREALSAVIADRIRKEKEEDDRKARAYEEVCMVIRCTSGMLTYRLKRLGHAGRRLRSLTLINGGRVIWQSSKRSGIEKRKNGSRR